MRNKREIQKTAQELTNSRPSKEELTRLYELIKKSDDKETSPDYKEHMIRVKRHLSSKDEYSVFNAIHEINMALQVVGIKINY